MAHAVDQLERAGYLQRRPNPQDGRSRLVFLTERGAAANTAGNATEQRGAELTSPEEVEQLRSLLHRLLTRIGDADPEARERLAMI
ncbi:hypothetical protein GCM10020218_061910 [Dactylosporangium vinaceum]|nr:winged helix DNA-binding protein [Dactylosporangium vinaceum]